MLGKPKHLGVQNGRMGLAVSDGELSSSGSRGSNNSVASLPSNQSATHSLGQSVARWAESFETLLQDRLGVAYFTEFLKKEFSAENVYFWQACERFQQIPASSTQQLTQEARRIYDEFLSSHSVSPVNIDRQAWIGEEMLTVPTPDMFHVQQLQIFNLMKFDSYARFVKSPLYQACAKAESQGQPLPELRPHSRSGSPPSDHGKKTKLKPGKSLPLGVEVAGNLGSRSPRRSFRKSDHRERPWGEERKNGSEGPSLWRESQGSLNSSASLDLGFLSSCATSSSQTETHRKSLTDPESDNQNQPVKYCCIYLPDGTASLIPVRPGLSIQEMLSGICQRRGFHLPDIKIYLVGNDKKPLALNQDSIVLMDQEVKLETRVSFEMEIIHINKTVRILAKSTKQLREALKPILDKHGLDVTRMLLRRPGEFHAIDLEEKVSTVASQKLVLESDTEVKPAGASHAITSPSCGQSEEDISVETEPETESLSEGHCSFTRPTRSNQNRRTYDLEGLVELLNRAQSCRVNDQRGILSKEDLVLPEFLQLPEQDGVSYDIPSSSQPDLEKKCTLETPITISHCQSQEQSEAQASTSKQNTGHPLSPGAAGETSAM
ncbi:regulator of G-protein signaling 14 isoform X2 [Paroedura picta]|uniref:regulator of G-protein signaling 14 isoform X2 n=1 Tax=Paroedura picta TaxID=143630 RepID=UPI0040560D4D